jgi:hypothetical protein
MKVRAALLAMTVLVVAVSLLARGASPNVSFERREIKALSEADIAELERGGGWGLALAAELNGVPGPAHLLELAHEIPLTGEQVEAIEAIFGDMHAEAIAEGERFLAIEEEIEARFRGGDMTDDVLRDLTARSAESLGRLRYIHLSRHLLTPDLLTAQQIAAYGVLRGYGGASDRCDAVPEGHDPDMWRRHNACE